MLSLQVRDEQDAVLACQRVRQLGQLLGLSAQDQARATTSISEVISASLHPGCGVRVELGVGGQQAHSALRVRVVDRQGELERSDLGDACQLVDRVQTTSDAHGGGAVVLDLDLPARAARRSSPELEALGGRLSDIEPPSMLAEVHQRNRQALQAMEDLQRGRGKLARLNEALDARAVEWQATFDAIGDALCVLDADARVVQANRAMASLLGVDGDLAGRAWDELSPLTAAQGAGRPLETARRTGRRAVAPARHQDRWYRVQVDPLLEDDAPRRYVVLAADVTEDKLAVDQLMRSEGKLRAIFDHSAVGLWLVPVRDGEPGDGWPAEGSPALERFWGYSAAELEGLTLRELCHPEEVDADASLRQELLADQRPSYQLEQRFVHRDGHELWGDVSVSLIRSPDGDPAYLVYTVVDITQRKAIEQGLAQINEALRAYAHTVSHDLKGPLAGAIAAGQVLGRMLDEPLTEASAADLRELAGVFAGSVGRSVDLINNLLALAEAEQGAAQAALVDVEQVLSDVLADRAALLDRWEVTVDVGRPLGQVRMAPAHLYQVLANLVDNAVKHGRGDPPQVRVERLPAAAPGEHTFRVRDNGPGIAAALADTLFDEFVRGSGEGSGIGLATVRKIARAHGGEARAFNDGGACIEVTLRDPA